MTFKHLIAIAADCYNPLLLIISLSIVLRFALKKNPYYAAEFALIVILVYGFMFLDKSVGIWPAFKSDFSTHSATAVAMILFISIVSSKIQSLILWLSFLLYAVVMIYLNYHTALDIISTGLVIGFATASILYFFQHGPLRFNVDQRRIQQD